MNKYGLLAMNHWKRTDPARYAAIPTPETFFSTLGEQVESQIQDLADQLAGPDPPGEDYLEKVGRLNMARLSAEEQVLAEQVLIPAPGSEEDEADPETDARMSELRAFQAGLHRDLHKDPEADALHHR